MLHFEYKGADGRINYNVSKKNKVVNISIGFSWIRIETSGWLLRTQ
jgi:hypothetical protein